MTNENLADEHIEALLPWYINNTLDLDERQQVEAALKESETLREELEFLKNLALSVKSEEMPEASELGWRRLQKQIALEERDHEEPTTQHAAKISWFKPFIASAAVLVIALQLHLNFNTQQDAASRLLSAPSVILAEPHWRFQLEIANQASWEEVSALMNTLNASIIEGPSSLGIISIAVPQKNSAYTRPEDLEAWLEKQALIRFVTQQTP